MRTPSVGREKEALRTAPGVLVFKSGRMVRAFMKMRKGLTDYGKDGVEETQEIRVATSRKRGWFTGWSPVEI